MTGRTVLITGAGGQVGREASVLFARAGWDVVACDRAALDIRDRAAVLDAVAGSRAAAVVNLAAAGHSADRVCPISTAEMDPPRLAPRPRNSVLDGATLRLSGVPPLRHHAEALAELVAEIEQTKGGGPLMKGIILAGGAGTRLHPITRAVSKQLLPVFDKPMIYYPLSVLMLAGIRDILVITTPEDNSAFRRLLGDGAEWGISLTYAEQPSPNGLAEAFILGADHIGDDDVALVLGDNIFHGHSFSETLASAGQGVDGCVLFGYPVRDPERYGVGEMDADGRLVSIEEKPIRPKSNLAITGLYMYDNDVVGHAAELKPSDRGELEITDLNNIYLEAGKASLLDLGRGFAWLDTGTHDSLVEASQFVQILEHRQGIRIACLEEIALRQGFINAEACFALGEAMSKSPYGKYVLGVARAAGALG